MQTHAIWEPLFQPHDYSWLDIDMNSFIYDVALSFAGENREYVEEVAAILKSKNINVFYDKYETSNLWGKDLYDHLQDVYYKQAKYTVMFISKEYAQKVWTNHERKCAQARALNERGEYILPARFDDTELPGLLPTIWFIDLRKTAPEELAKLIIAKLTSQGFSTSQSPMSFGKEVNSKEQDIPFLTVKDVGVNTQNEVNIYGWLINNGKSSAINVILAFNDIEIHRSDSIAPNQKERFQKIFQPPSFSKSPNPAFNIKYHDLDGSTYVTNIPVDTSSLMPLKQISVFKNNKIITGNTENEAVSKTKIEEEFRSNILASDKRFVGLLTKNGKYSMNPNSAHWTFAFQMLPKVQGITLKDLKNKIYAAKDFNANWDIPFFAQTGTELDPYPIGNSIECYHPENEHVGYEHWTAMPGGFFYATRQLQEEVTGNDKNIDPFFSMQQTAITLSFACRLCNSFGHNCNEILFFARYKNIINRSIKDTISVGVPFRNGHTVRANEWEQIHTVNINDIVNVFPQTTKKILDDFFMQFNLLEIGEQIFASKIENFNPKGRS